MTRVKPDQPGGPKTLDDQSVGELFARTTDHLSRLVNAEIALIKVQLRTDVQRTLSGSMMFVVAALLGCVGFFVLSLAAAYGLITLGVWDWAAFLIVGLGYVLLATVCVLLGRRRMRRIGALSRSRERTRWGASGERTPRLSE
jgi:hypothetical protein